MRGECVQRLVAGRYAWTPGSTRRAAWFVSILLLVSLIFALATTAPLSAQDSEDDHPFPSIARQVPTFGGMYINGQTLYVWLTDQGQSLDEAVEAIRSSFRKGKFDHLTPVALRAKYSFLQLYAWQDQMDGVLSIDGAIYTDIDDRSNRLTVAVDDVAAQGPAVEAELKRVGVPLAAVDILQEEPIIQLPGPGASPLDPAAASVPLASRERAAGSPNSKDSWLWVAPGLALGFIGLIVFAAMRSRRRSQDEPSSSIAAVGR